ncbi:ComEC/Rec2 family competence protein [Lentiprolixibacter aurantiacus]|uniref:ComEC/Rec2 family competence protein n=1 Tax=Lentiprolixibacter aurantiacus TaxID=2993939 RepID=A0AAE3SLV0_9FLAO|nr:ComEC/Rec2 family competence protein [Lentiprolixibacter aurantiacus]MCX2718077.1 ComEC/Rec2 family competence protein [Lentiprolixibacter aurantiacus]
MKPMNFLAVKLACLLILGILSGYVLNIGPTLAIVTSAISVVLLAISFLFSRGKSVLFGICAAITTLSAGILSYALSSELHHEGHYNNVHISQMQLWHLKIRGIEKPTPFSSVYRARVLSLDQNPARGSIQLRIKRSDSVNLNLDDEILVWGSAREITPALNPYQWDYAQYLEKRNIYLQLHTSSPYLHTLNSSPKTLRGWASGLRKTLLNKLHETGIPERELSIVKAMLLGERADVSPETFDAYRKAGAIHILAISGLHVGIILLLLRFLLQPLTRLPGGKQVALTLSVILLWGYALLAGFGPSVIRAVAMFSFLAYSLFLNRVTHGYNTLALSLLFLLLLINPLLIFEVGFQMSYAAVGGILWIYPVLVRKWQPRVLIAKRIWQVAAVSLSAQLGVFPISLFYFHQFPGLFMVSSLVVIPFLGLILGTGFAVSLLALINQLPQLLVDFYGSAIYYLNEFIAWISGMDSFHFENLPFGPLELALTYLLIFCLIRMLQKPGAKWVRLTLASFLMIQLCGIFYAWDTGNTSRLIIGHQYGDPILISQNGKQLTTHTSAKTIYPHTLKNYKLGARTRAYKEYPLKNSYVINGESLIRLDSSLLVLSEKEIDYLWLTHSPRINLDRYLAAYSPKKIIADGSSPPYLVDRWRQSARSSNIPFHYTGRDGAFEFRSQPSPNERRASISSTVD